MTSPLQIKDQQQIEEIVTLLKHTQETGSFLFVTCSGPTACEAVESAIRESLGQDAPVRAINLAEGERDLAARIREGLADLKVSRPVYFIDGLPQVVAEEKAKQPDGLSPTLSQLNLSLELVGTTATRDTVLGSTVLESGGTEFFLAPGLQYFLGPRWIIETAVEIPISRGLERPLGLKPDVIVIWGFRGVF